jgi:hypothetical protein
MTEKELIHRAKVFMNNCGANNEKISYGDALKVVLLSDIVDDKRHFTTGEMELILRLVQNKNFWYKFW